VWSRRCLWRRRPQLSSVGTHGQLCPGSGQDVRSFRTFCRS
jgi:hypothetical protein